MLLRDGGVGYVNIATGEPRAIGQRKGDGGAAVSRERADFQIIFHANQSRQPRQQSGLLGGDCHFAETMRFGMRADLSENGMLGFADLAQIGE